MPFKGWQIFILQQNDVTHSYVGLSRFPLAPLLQQGQILCAPFSPEVLQHLDQFLPSIETSSLGMRYVWLWKRIEALAF